MAPLGPIGKILAPVELKPFEGIIDIQVAGFVPNFIIRKHIFSTYLKIICRLSYIYMVACIF